MRFDTEVFVLGGGPAGLAAAIAARSSGLSVTLADAMRPPIDKACGEGLMPDALLSAARRLGIEVPAGAGHPFHGIRFIGPGNMVAAEFSGSPGLGLRRTVLHQLLVTRAENAGVELNWNCPVTGINGHNVRLGQTTITAHWIVGADGARSSIRRWAGLEDCYPESRWFGSSSRFSFRRHYHVAPWSEFVEVHWGDGCQFYITPVAPAEVCVVFMSHDPHFRIDQALPHFPELQSRLRGCQIVTVDRGASAAMHRLRRVVRGNVALLGDASGTVDPITGKGVCLAFEQASALAEALQDGDLKAYQRAHRRIVCGPRLMGNVLLTMDRWPQLRTRALRAMEAHPHLFANLLAMHVGKLGMGKLAATAAILGWEVATA